MKSYSVQAERTKYFLKQAFITLVHQKGFSAVTVKDIVTEAQYNRTTFYTYYKDKFDLADELVAEMSAQIQHYSISKYTPQTPIDVRKMHAHSFDLLYFIYDHRHYFSLLCKRDTLPQLQSQLADTLFQVFVDQFDFHYHTKNIDDHVQKRYMAYGTAGIISDWIRDNFRQSPSDMTLHFIQVLQTFLSHFTIQLAPEKQARV